MKKKILSVLLILVLMMGMLLGLTACGDEDDEETSSRKKTSKVEIEEEEETTDVPIDDDFYTEDDLKATSSNSSEDYSIAAHDDELQAVCLNLNDKKYVIIDNNGKKVGEYDRWYQLTGNGKYLRGFNKDTGYEIYDLNEKNVLKATENISYGEVSKSGYTIRTTKEESLAGVSTKQEIINVETEEVIYSAPVQTVESSSKDFEKLKYYGNDMFYFDADEYGDNTAVLINAKTGVKKDVDYNCYFEFWNDNDEFGYQQVIGYSVGEYVIGLDCEQKYEIENKEAKISYKDGYMLMNKDNKYQIAKLDGTVIYTIEEGGIRGISDTRSISYGDGKFGIVSETGYFYQVDTNGKRVTEPIKIDDNKSERSEFLAYGKLYYLDTKTAELYKLETDSGEYEVILNPSIPANDLKIKKINNDYSSNVDDFEVIEDEMFEIHYNDNNNHSYSKVFSAKLDKEIYAK